MGFRFRSPWRTLEATTSALAMVCVDAFYVYVTLSLSTKVKTEVLVLFAQSDPSCPPQVGPSRLPSILPTSICPPQAASRGIVPIVPQNVWGRSGCGVKHAQRTGLCCQYNRATLLTVSISEYLFICLPQNSPSYHSLRYPPPCRELPKAV